ncbi:MAG: hypothetical protein CMF49_02070 [Legionellales bacterium]|nr:hypothetical protein [Legionellales bacterium]|tara:strand:- start:444 stop:1277 length:834 start_codon:yes stop_codon:yes gene_type:complete
MEAQLQKMTPLTVIKQIWCSSWQSLWTGEKRTLSVTLIGYGTILVLMVASILYLSVTGQFVNQPKAVGQLPLPLIDLIIIMTIVLLLGNFITAALITRSYAWLNKDTQLANKTWHNAKRCFLQLFVIHAAVLCFDIGLQYGLTVLTVNMSEVIKFCVSLLGFLVYLTAITIPFVTFTAIVIESMPLGKAITQGFKLLKANWAFSISILTLGIFVPMLLLMSFLQVPYLNILLGLFLIFAFYPFLLVLLAFTNIFMYQHAQKKYQAVLKEKGVNITQA